MQNNKDFNSSQYVANQDADTSVRITINGTINFSKHTPNNCSYSAKLGANSPNPNGRLPKGFDGLSYEQKELIESAIYTFCIDYGLHNFKWIVLPFDKGSSDEQLNNLLINFNKLEDSVKYILNKVYRKIYDRPYFVVYGLRKDNSYARKIPCLEVNILCLVTDTLGNNIINPKTIVDHVYRSASRLSGDIIQPPVNYYNENLWNTLDVYKQLSNYLKDQVDSRLLEHFQNSDYAKQLPNTWCFIPPRLKEKLDDIYKANYPTDPREMRKLIVEALPCKIELDKNNHPYKGYAQIINPLPENIMSCANRLEKYLDTFCPSPDRINNSISD